MSKYQKEAERLRIGSSNSSRSKYEGDFNAINNVRPPQSDVPYGPPDISTSSEVPYGPPDVSTPTVKPGRDIPIIGSILKGLDWVASNPISTAVAEYAVPDAPDIDPDAPWFSGATLPGTNARQDFLERTGQEPATGFPKFVGQVAAPFFVPGAQLGTGTALSNTAGNIVSKYAPRLEGSGQAAVREGLAGVPIGFASEYAQGEGDLGQAALSGALGGALGAVGGAAIPAIGKAVIGAKNASSKALTEALQDIKDLSPENRGLGITPFSKTSPYDNLRTDTKSQLTSKLSKEPVQLDKAADRAYAKIVDDLNEANNFDKLVSKVRGEDLQPTESAYKLGLGTRGSDIISRQILTQNFVDNAGTVIGKSLKEVLEPLPKGKGTFVDLEDYLINKHAITRAGRDEKVFDDKLKWTPEKGQAKIAEYENKYPQFKQLSDNLYEYQRNLVDKWLVDTGMLTRQQADNYFKANPEYVPMQRFFTDMEKVSGGRGGTKQGFANQSNPVKRYGKFGSQRKIISPIESIIENTDRFVKTARRNQVMQAVVNSLRRNPEELKGYAEIIEQPKGLDDIKNVDLTTSEGLDDLLGRLDQDFDKNVMKTKFDKDNIVRVMVNGEPVHLKINDKDFLKMVTALGSNNGHVVMDAIGKVTNFFKLVTTGANPVFSLTRNIFRDIPQAYVASKSTNNPVQFVADLFKAGFDIAANRKAFQEYKNLGGGHSSPIAADRNLLAASKRSVLPQNKVKGVVPKAWDKFQDFLNAMETAPRLAEYKRFAKGGDLDSKLRGLFEAQDVTTNFKKKGSVTRELDKIFPYMGAAVSGLDKVARVYKDNPGLAIGKAFAAITIPTMVAYAYNYDNPDYQKVSNNVKDNFILIPKGDGTFYKIAKPKEIGAVFSDIPERLMRHFFEKDPEAFADFATQLKNTFLIPGVQGFATAKGGIPQRIAGIAGDTIAGPVQDIAANKTFTGGNIVPGYLQGLSPELQYDARTSAPAKFIGAQTGSSPKEIDYLIRQYTGGIGQFGIPLLSPGGSVGEALKQQVTTDPVFSNNIMNKFYDNKERYDKAQKDSTVTGKHPAWYDDNVRKKLGAAERKMGDIRKKMRALENDKTTPAASKRAQLRAYQEQLNAIAAEANKNVRKE